MRKIPPFPGFFFKIGQHLAATGRPTVRAAPEHRWQTLWMGCKVGLRARLLSVVVLFLGQSAQLHAAMSSELMVIGPVQHGKSTLINLLMDVTGRLLDPECVHRYGYDEADTPSIPALLERPVGPWNMSRQLVDLDRDLQLHRAELEPIWQALSAQIEVHDLWNHAVQIRHEIRGTQFEGRVRGGFGATMASSYHVPLWAGPLATRCSSEIQRQCGLYRIGVFDSQGARVFSTARSIRTRTGEVADLSVVQRELSAVRDVAEKIRSHVHRGEIDAVLLVIRAPELIVSSTSGDLNALQLLSELIGRFRIPSRRILLALTHASTWDFRTDRPEQRNLHGIDPKLRRDLIRLFEQQNVLELKDWVADLVMRRGGIDLQSENIFFFEQEFLAVGPQILWQLERLTSDHRLSGLTCAELSQATERIAAGREPGEGFPVSRQQLWELADIATYDNAALAYLLRMMWLRQKHYYHNVRSVIELAEKIRAMAARPSGKIRVDTITEGTQDILTELSLHNDHLRSHLQLVAQLEAIEQAETQTERRRVSWRQVLPSRAVPAALVEHVAQERPVLLRSRDGGFLQFVEGDRGSGAPGCCGMLRVADPSERSKPSCCFQLTLGPGQTIMVQPQSCPLGQVVVVPGQPISNCWWRHCGAASSILEQAHPAPPGSTANVFGRFFLRHSESAGYLRIEAAASVEGVPGPLFLTKPWGGWKQCFFWAQHQFGRRAGLEDWELVAPE